MPAVLVPLLYPWYLIPSHGPVHVTMDYLNWNPIFSPYFVTHDPQVAFVVVLVGLLSA